MTVIEVRNLSKTYLIGPSLNNESLRETISRNINSRFNLFKNVDNTKKKNTRINALSDITFDIQPGQTVGIVGKNGSGKSTLLKIISRVTRPTSGSVNVYGRVGSLLEVGTGFHPELTGRENIFLSGAIMGLKRTEILQRFDEIVDFSGTDEFIDTPVKRYSSGMFMRLAFSVVINLRPDILLVDEVLAVGDHAFQLQAIHKLRNLKGSGTTIVFVSHNARTIARLCDRALFLENGYLQADGPAANIIDLYTKNSSALTASFDWSDTDSMPKGNNSRLCSVKVGNEANYCCTTLFSHQCVRVEIEYEVLSDSYELMLYFQVYNSEELELFWSHNSEPDIQNSNRTTGRYISTVWIPKNLLTEGIYHIEFGCETKEGRYTEFHATDARLTFQIIDQPGAPNARGQYTGEMNGIIRPKLIWDTKVA